MTVKFIDLKAAPLLSPPIENLGWAKASPEDHRKALEYLDSLRRSRDGYGTVGFLNLMRKAGIDEPVAEWDIRDMRRDVEAGRKEKDGYKVGYMLYHMKTLGIDEEVTPADIELLRAGLIRERGDASYNNSLEAGRMLHWMNGLGLREPVTEYDRELMGVVLQESRETDGWAIAVALDRMREEGIDEAPTAKDKAAMKEHIRQLRRDGNGEYLLLMHEKMKGIGVIEEITPGDKGILREFLALRRREGGVAKLLEALAAVREILPPTEQRTPQQMPALKRFET